MSANPFSADPEVPRRLAGQDGDALRAAAAPLIRGMTLAADDARALAARFGMDGDDLLLHLRPLAEARAVAPVSGFRVGAVGRTDRGTVLLGHNVEAPGAALAHTIHGEGFLAMRAHALGEPLVRIALGEAHPCAHCRQVLAEFGWRDGLVLLDPLGHRLTLADLYPWPFDPAYLGETGAVPGSPRAVPPGLPDAVAAALAEAGSRAHAPYSNSPAAVAVETPGGVFAGAGVESVAFNPTLTPMMAALVALLAADENPAAIRRAWLVQGGPTDLAASTREHLFALAPAATLEILEWP